MTPAGGETAPGDLVALMREIGLDPIGPLEPLTGGVSCDVYRAALADGPVCVKRALSRLRVAADWRASASRSHSEVRWLQMAEAVEGVLAPRVIAEHRAENLFVMSWFEPRQHPVWKAELAEGRIDAGFAAQVGDGLGAVHAHAARSPALADEFSDLGLFADLRLKPYFAHTAVQHPDLAGRLSELIHGFSEVRLSLVHGDVSPKNILTGAALPVFLDAECAVWGDPAFDLAFCLNHLLLKTVWRPAGARAYLAAFGALRAAYLARVDWEAPAALEARATRFLAALLLARVDGKSPVEYLTDAADTGFVRAAARAFLLNPPSGLAALAGAWAERIERR